jgi:hypothetical protein
LLTGEGEGDGGGAKSYDSEKAWSSINHSFSIFLLKLFQIEGEGVEKCAEEIVRQVSEGNVDINKMFAKSDVGPRAAGL